jgi:hypothetical protein
MCILGVQNTIYRCNLDDLHSLLAGIIKCCLIFTLVILYEISLNDSKFKAGFTVFNEFISGFQSVPVVPHVEWTSFKKGLGSLIENQSQKAKQGDTGSGGGYRSTHLLPALIQTYFAIVCNPGKFLPVEKRYQFVKKKAKNLKTSKEEKFSANVGNVHLIVLTAIRDVLNFYFVVKREEVLYEDTCYRNSFLQMESSYNKLWLLKQTIMLNFSGAIQSKSRKIHEGTHLDLTMGTPSVYSTGPYECVHRFTTVDAWESTSGRLIPRGEEMLSYQLRSVYLSHYMTYRRVFLHREQAFEMSDDGISTVFNVKNCVFTITWDEETMIIPEFHFKNNEFNIENIFTDPQNTYVYQMNVSKFYDMLSNNHQILHLLCCKDYRHRFVQKVSYSDKHWGKGMYRVGGFATVSCKSEDDTPQWKDVVARIEFIIETSLVDPTTGEVIQVID